MQMIPLSNTLKRFTIVLFVFMLLSFGFPGSVSAQGIVYGDGVPDGTVVEGDILLAGDHVVIAGDVNGDVVAVGRSVSVSGDIAGSLIVAGQDVSIDGDVGGSVYSLAFTLKAGAESVVGRSLYFGGMSINLHPGSMVNSDLNVVSLGAQLSAEVGRNVHAIIGPLEFIQLIVESLGGEFDLATTMAPSPRSPEAIRAMGAPRLISIILSSQVEKVQQLPGESLQDEFNVDWDGVVDWLEGRGRELIPLLLVGLLMIWLFPTFLSGAADQIVEKPIHTLGYGLLALVLALNAVALLILIGMLVLVIGLWLGVVSVWDFAFVFWGIGVASISLLFSLFAMFVLYGSKVIVTYLTGYMILKPFAPQANEHKIVPFMIGLVIFIVLVSIPILGFALRIIVTGIGLGATWVFLLERRKATPKRTTRAKK
jgi:hypothetical protein